MSTNIRDWLAASMEERNDDAPVIVQDGDTPKEDFSTATNEDSGEVDTDKPATAEIDAASDGAEKGKDIDQGHQEVHVPDNDGKVSNEDASEEARVESAEEETPAVEEHREEAQEETVSQEENVTEESAKKDDIDAEDADTAAKAPTEDKVIEPDEQTDAKVEEPVVAKLEENEAGDEQKTPESDEQVDPDPKGAQTEEASSEEHVVGDETDVTPAVDEADGDETHFEDDAEKITKVEGDITHFQEVSESLEAYRAILDHGMENHDGVHADTAEAIRLGVERLDPMFRETEIIPSTEAFGGVSSRRTATRIALDGINTSQEQLTEAMDNAKAYLASLTKEEAK